MESSLEMKYLMLIRLSLEQEVKWPLKRRDKKQEQKEENIFGKMGITTNGLYKVNFDDQ